MGKITFRADDDLVDRLEALDASKSEVMREALRSYLSTQGQPEHGVAEGRESIDQLIRERVDAHVADALAERQSHSSERRSRERQDVNVNVTIDGDTADRNTGVSRSTDASVASTDHATQCEQCGHDIGSDHVYCPNCGEKASRRSFCECGDELRSDWAFCPSCGRRTPAADVLDSK